MRNELKQTFVIANKGQRAGQQHKQHNTAAPYVNGLRVGLPLHHLGTHVVGRADATTRDQRIAAVVIGQLNGNAEAAQFDGRRILLARQQYAVRLYIAVNYVRLVAIADCFQYLPHVMAGHGLRVNEAGVGALLDLEAQVSSVHAARFEFN